MELFLEHRGGRQRLALADGDLLGVGGEAQVFRWSQLAIKVFHPVDGATPEGARLRRLKLEKLAHFPAGLPETVVAPVCLVTDKKRQTVGYAMRAIDAGEDFARLAQRRWREGRLSNGAVMALFEQLREMVESLHAKGVVVGDLNDGNVLFAAGRPWLIDADSMQFGSYSCTVGHERFLDPRLYGVDLASGPAFTAQSDWYALAVMLFSSLLYAHPFGGVHPEVPTPLRRAEARLSVFDARVQYPRAAVHYRVLPDDANGWFQQVFERDAREPLPASLLGLRWTRCKCGAEHARAACPECARLGVVSAREVVRAHGRCTAKQVLRTSGRIVAWAQQGGLRFAVEEQGRLRREDGFEVGTGQLSPDATVALCGRQTWIGEKGAVSCFERGSVALRASSGLRGARTCLAGSSATVVGVQDEWLVDLVTGARMGKVLAGQTLLWLGERLGFLLYRAGALTFSFLFRPGRAGLKRVELPALSGRLVDAHVAFDDEHLLFAAAVERDGRRRHSLALVDSTGQVLARVEGAPHEQRMLASVRGKALFGGRIVSASDDGLVSLSVVPLAGGVGGLVEGTLFADCAPFLSSESELLAGPGGTVYVKNPGEILQLSLV